MNFIGNRKIVEYFGKLTESDGLSHAYCLVGIDQIGKRKLANVVASKILNVIEEKLFIHPDYHYISREINAKTGKMKKDINISQIRVLKSKICSKSWLAKYNIVIIDEAELLNKESSNALLKVLEESEGKSIFFLLTTNDNLLLPTIRSRCQTFYLNLVSSDEILSGLKELGCEGGIEEAAKLSWGRPGRAIDILEDDGIKTEYINEFKRWQNMIGKDFGCKLRQMDDLVGKNVGTDKDKINKVLDIWIVLWRGIMRSQMSGTDVKMKVQYSVSSIKDFIDLFNESKKMLRQNVNPNLIIENILLTI